MNKEDAEALMSFVGSVDAWAEKVSKLLVQVADDVENLQRRVKGVQGRLAVLEERSA